MRQVCEHMMTITYNETQQALANSAGTSRKRATRIQTLVTSCMVNMDRWLRLSLEQSICNHVAHENLLVYMEFWTCDETPLVARHR